MYLSVTPRALLRQATEPCHIYNVQSRVKGATCPYPVPCDLSGAWGMEF